MSAGPFEPVSPRHAAEIRAWLARTKPEIFAFLDALESFVIPDTKVEAIFERFAAYVAGAVLDVGCLVGTREEIAKQLSARGIFIACQELGLPVPPEVTAVLGGSPLPLAH